MPAKNLFRSAFPCAWRSCRAERLPARADGGATRAKKYANLILPDVVIEEQIVKPQAMSAGAYGNSRNDGKLVSPSLAVTMNGSLSLRSPGPDHIGNQHEARFVGKDDVGTQPCGVFFMRGHSSRFQRSISSSFRSSARRSGFCGVHPRLCIKRPIWSG